MKERRIFSLSIFLLFVFLFVSVSIGSDGSRLFQLVESVPVGTEYEKSELPRTLDVWLDMFNNAEHKIDIEIFYFANKDDEPLENIVNALKSAALRGVYIRIIVDETFYLNNERGTDLLEDISNIVIKKIPFKQIAGGVMHAKYFVVDEKELFIGSQNADWRALKHIHELGVRVKNKKLASAFMNVFDIDWLLCDEFSKPPDERNIEKIQKLLRSKNKNIVNSRKPVKINDSKYGKIILYPAFSPTEYVPDGCDSEENEILKLIAASKNIFYLQVMNYSVRGESKSEKYYTLDSALRYAAYRGVNVKIIFSDWTIREGTTEIIKDLSTVPGIEIKFSSVPQYSGGFIPYSRVEHCKYFVSDNLCSFISTSNWEKSYFHKSRNASLVVKNKKINNELKNLFMNDWNGPYTEKVITDKIYTPVKRN
ncbi:MAG: hypothetical protein FJ216_08485 [Ignavibacteria bacterium]|nr:hypothetical protein [Ignavibacteria bacterium]